MWEGMVHVFPTNSLLGAAAEALDLIAGSINAMVAGAARAE